MADKKSPAFEQTMAELEQLVTLLESGDLPLDKALEAYERGHKLVKQCQAVLDAAELKIEHIEKDKAVS